MNSSCTARWLAPDSLLMATATPRDQRLLDFLASAGKCDFESFTVSHDDVVAVRLNKHYIEAVVYDLRQSVQGVADLKRTVLRQAWKRSQRLKVDLAAAGVALTPLLNRVQRDMRHFQFVFDSADVKDLSGTRFKISYFLIS